MGDNEKAISTIIQNEIGELDVLQKKYKEAILFFEEALSYYESTWNVEDIEQSKLLIKIYDNISKCYREIGDYSKSLEYSKKAFDILKYM